jgi:hypothetical protein
MVRPLGEVLKTIGGYGFHIYDDGGARWITIRYETDDAAKKASLGTSMQAIEEKYSVPFGGQVQSGGRVRQLLTTVHYCPTHPKRGRLGSNSILALRRRERAQRKRALVDSSGGRLLPPLQTMYQRPKCMRRWFGFLPHGGGAKRTQAK